jgi:hypothetical protein
LVQEDLAIAALGERIEPILVAYRAAAEDRLKARASAEASCPAVLEELVSESSVWAERLRRWWQSTLAHCFQRRWQAFLASAAENSEVRQNESRCCSRNPLLRPANHVREEGRKARLIELAEKYEAERATAIEQSGLHEAMARHYAEAEIEVGHYRGRAGQLVGLALAQSLTRLSA